jgi:hypothetical protein
MSYRDYAIFQQGLQHLGAALDKWKKEKEYNQIANSLMNQQSDNLRALPVKGTDPGIGNSADQTPVKMPFTSGYAGLKISDDILNRELTKAKIHRFLNPKKGVDYVDTPYGQMQPYQAASLGILPSGSGTGGDGSYDEPPTDVAPSIEGSLANVPQIGDERNGMVYRGRGVWIKARTATKDSMAAIDRDVYGATGHHYGEWDATLKNSHFMVDDNGNPVDQSKASGFKAGSYRTGLSGYQALLKGQERARALTGGGPTPQTALPDNGPVQAATDVTADKFVVGKSTKTL